MKLVLSFFTAWLSSFSLSAHALIEARVSYGLGDKSIAVQELCSNCTSQASVNKNFSGLGADGLIKLPVPYLPAFGVRYESLGTQKSSEELDLNLSYSRTALLIQWRPIDSTFYFGPTLSYGLSHSFNAKAREQEIEKANMNSKSAESYSAGIEGGFKVIDFLIGAEVGYNELQWNKAKDASGNLQDINLSGAYGKLILGFSI